MKVGTHHHRNSKLHDIAETEQYSEKKVSSLYEDIPKPFLNPTPNPKSPLGPPKVKKNDSKKIVKLKS